MYSRKMADLCDGFYAADGEGGCETWMGGMMKLVGVGVWE